MINFGSIAKYSGFFVLFFVLMSANIRGVTPFAFGMLFALIWCNQKVYILVPLYILSGVLCGGTIEQLIIDSITAGVALIAFCLHYYFRKPLNHILIGCYAFLSQFGLLYMSAGVPEAMWRSIVTLVLGVICLYAYLNLFQNLILKGVRRKFGIDEIICFGILLFGLGAGVYGLPFSEYYAFGLLALVILLANYILGISAAMVISIFLGVGVAFASGNFLYLSHIIFLDLFVALAQSNKRIFASLIIIFADAISGLFFLNNFSLGQFLSVVVGALIYLIMPPKIVNILRDVVLTDKEDFAVRTLINKNRKNLCTRLYDLSDVFTEMQQVFMQMVSSYPDFEKGLDFLVEQVRRQNCSVCPKRAECMQKNASINDAIASLFVLGYQRGKASLIDAAPVLTSTCVRLSLILSSINNLTNEYKSNRESNENLNSGRRLLSEQMSGIAEIIQSLAKEIGVEVTFDTELEKLLREELMYAGIQCAEAVFYQQDAKICQATLVIKSKDVRNSDLIKVVSKVLGVSVEIDTIQDDAKPTYSVVTLKNANNYKIIFGTAAATKAGSQKSGDTYSVLKIGKNKVLLSLCDGMGSGKLAQKESTLALNMIESFYKAGFGSDLILRSTNQLLTLNCEERFSALDICVVDLFDGVCDLIKVGTPPSFVKNGTEINQIDCASLPLGILEELKPSMSTLVLSDNDMIVLATDGVVDSFASIDEMRSKILTFDTQNPQEVANGLLKIALANYNNYPQDDMTVLVAKIFCKE